MDVWFGVFLMLGLSVTAGLTVLVARLVPTVARHFMGSPVGWSALAGVYGVTMKTPPKAWRGQSIVVGRVLYRNCVAVAPTEGGLYLRLGFPASILGRPALLIPWRSFKHRDEARLFWREAALLSLGEPTKGTLTLPLDAFEKIRPYLPADMVDARCD